MLFGVLIGVDGLLASALATSGIWAYRSLRQARAERDAARNAEQELQSHNQNLDSALNNMSQGLCMFNAAGEIVLCNQAYLRMYSLSPEVVKPGCTLRRLIEHRRDVGLFNGDVDH
jgi:PAS domain-containing protein